MIAATGAQEMRKMEKQTAHSLAHPDIEIGVGAMSPPAMERSRHRSSLLDVGMQDDK